MPTINNETKAPEERSHIQHTKLIARFDKSSGDEPVITVPEPGEKKKRLRELKRRGIRSVYGDQTVCLLAISGMAFWRFGGRAAMLILATVVICVLTDLVCCRLRRMRYSLKDLSTINTGLCIALMMPVSVSYHLAAVGAVVAIAIKHIFGGKDNYIFSPAAVTAALFIICYPAKMLLFPAVGEQLPAFGGFTITLSSGIESYLMKTGTSSALSVLDLFLGNFQGAMGTTHVLIILVCMLCLMCRRSISPIVTLSTLGTALGIFMLFPLYENYWDTIALELIGGYFLFGLVFLANDPQTLPKTVLGKLYYGVTLGLLTVAFRYFGKVEGCFVFALLIANALAVHTDTAAAHTITLLKKLIAFLRKYLGSFERFGERARSNHTPSIYDTQEIVIPGTHYNTPPVDNKIIGVKRKKKNPFVVAVKFLSRFPSALKRLFHRGGNDVILPAPQKPIKPIKPVKPVRTKPLPPRKPVKQASKAAAEAKPPHAFLSRLAELAATVARPFSGSKEKLQRVKTEKNVTDSKAEFPAATPKYSPESRAILDNTKSNITESEKESNSTSSIDNKKEAARLAAKQAMKLEMAKKGAAKRIIPDKSGKIKKEKRK